MPNKSYLRGRAFEYQLKHDLELLGYKVYRMAGSHGEVDLIAIDTQGNGFVRGYQCKTKLVNKIPEDNPKYEVLMSIGSMSVQKVTKFIRKRK